MLSAAQKLVLGQGGVPFGETCIYRPLVLLATSGVLALLGGEVTPEKAHLACSLATLFLTGLTAALVGLWLHLRCSLRLDLVFAALFCWLALPAVLPFAAEGLQTTPALFFGTAAFLAADLAVLRAGRRGARSLAFLVGPLLLLTLLSRDSFAVLLLPCALRLAQARGVRLPLLLAATGGGLAATGAWLALEAFLFHPDHSLLELLPATGLTLNQNRALLLDGEKWRRVGGILLAAVAYAPAVLALAGLFRKGRDLPPRLPLLLWLLLFTSLQVQFFEPGLRYFAPQALALLLLALRALPLHGRPGLAALVLSVLGCGSLAFSMPTVLLLHRLPHNHQVRAEKLGRLARGQDLILFLGQDVAYGRWLLPDRFVTSLWNLLPETERLELARDAGHSITRDSAVFGDLLRRVLVPTVRLGADRGIHILVVPEPEQLALFHGLTRAGLAVEVVERIPPGRSILQGDSFARRIGLHDPVSRREEQVLRLRPAAGKDRPWYRLAELGGGKADGPSLVLDRWYQGRPGEIRWRRLPPDTVNRTILVAPDPARVKVAGVEGTLLADMEHPEAFIQPVTGFFPLVRWSREWAGRTLVFQGLVGTKRGLLFTGAIGVVFLDGAGEPHGPIPAPPTETVDISLAEFTARLARIPGDVGSGPGADPAAMTLDRELLVIAHRGDSRTAPENTIPAILAAFAGGAGAVEVDLRLTADGHPVLLHDWTLDRTTDGKGALADHTLAEVRGLDAGSWMGPRFAGLKVPTLAEAVTAARDKGILYLDIKVPGTAPAIRRTLVAAGLPPDRIWVYVDAPLGDLREMIRMLPDTPVLWGQVPAVEGPASCAALKAMGLFGLDLPYFRLSRDRATRARKAGLLLCTFTIETPRQLARVVKLGVDAVETDDPRRIAGLLAAWRRRAGQGQGEKR